MPGVVAFLSPEWIAALDAAARSDGRLAELTGELALIVEHEVHRGPDEVVRFHVELSHGTVRVRAGAAPAATVRFSQDAATAWEVASGRGSAQRAFMTGRLRVGGDLRVLLDHADVLGQLHDAFAAVRAETTEA